MATVIQEMSEDVSPQTPATLPPLTREQLQTELRQVERDLEVAEGNENAIERTVQFQALREERDALHGELGATPITVNTLQIADARFLKQEELGEDGTVTGVMMQFVERYRESDGTSAAVTGRILDIGEYLNLEVGEQVYEALRETVIEGDLTTHELEWLAEELAQDNDLPGNAWRELSAADIGRYQVAIADDRREQTLDLDMENAEMTGAAWSRDID